ncbi:6-phosphogluconolactonase [Oleiphilus sp. HI0132]|uniref:6-phosphogluconolactonase n=1 Tax=Oleiphilus sp. HI0132 TaxID=1822270 RepID=UPI001E5DA316|nr:6-phosphogluconolactonase [Oleiphilus sp. HI0132]
MLWRNLHFWWGDERCVSANDEQSNYGEAMRLLFSHVLIPASNIHPIHGELAQEKALIEFKDEMLACLPSVSDGVNAFPIFDWVMLGIGEDGHTASLFPGQTDYDCAQSAVQATQPSSKQERISLSASVISCAKRVTFIALGKSKASVVREIVDQAEVSKSYPAANIFSRIIASSGCVEWYLDAESAAKLSEH